jgi:hypothetical protein
MGLARVIMISPDLQYNGVSYDYRVGSSHYQWLERAIDDARARGIPWVFIGMHKNCITAGNKPCEIGADLMNLMYAKRVDLIFQGHDHDYQRFKQLTCAEAGRFVASCVADDGRDGNYVKGAGSVLVINGTSGGGGITSINTGDPEYGYVAAWMGANSPNPGRGILKVTVTGTKVTVQYLGATTSYTDGFVIEARAA